MNGTNTGFWSGVASSGDGLRLVAVQSADATGTPCSGKIFTSSDGGKTWESKFPTKAVWSGVASSKAGGVLLASQKYNASAQPGSIFVSVDSGGGWIIACLVGWLISCGWLD